MCTLGTELLVVKKAVANIAFTQSSFWNGQGGEEQGGRCRHSSFEVFECSSGFSLALYYTEQLSAAIFCTSKYLCTLALGSSGSYCIGSEQKFCSLTI